MSVKTRSDTSEPLTYANAPRQTKDGITYLEDDAAFELMMRIVEEDKDFLDALAKQ